MLRSRSTRWVALLSLLSIGGCESFGRGVTEAVLKGSGGDSEDTRNCEVEGRPFPGIAPYLAAQDSCRRSARRVGDRPEVKVLYVHGIGTHVPGDGTTLRQTLAKSLGLDIRAPRPKRIVIASPSFPKQDLGEINVTPADRRRAPARSAVLRADLVADHPAGQGSARVRQGAGLCPAPRGA